MKLKRVGKELLILVGLLVFSVSSADSGSCVSGDCVNGYGIYVYSRGDRYEGEFQDNKPHGQGILIYRNGSRYVGGLRNGRVHGEGTYFFPNGDRLVVNSENGSSIEETFIKYRDVLSQTETPLSTSSTANGTGNPEPEKEQMALIIIICVILILGSAWVKKEAFSSIDGVVPTIMVASAAGTISSSVLFLIGIETGVSLVVFPIVWGISFVVSLNV